MNNDLISREALNIDELCRLRSDLKTGLVVGSTLRTQTQIDRFIKALDDVIDNAPTVERPQGKWKLDDTEQFCYCSNCEDTYYPRPLDPSWYYCPHCGAEIRGALGFRTDEDYSFKVTRYLKYDSRTAVPDGILDLCPACSKSLLKWFYDTEEAKAND